MPTPTIVEDLAQKVHRYLQLMEEQSAILRETPSRLDAAYKRVAQSPLAAKPGQAWAPASEQRQAYIKYMDDICDTIPVSDDERMQVIFAAHAAMVCTRLFIIGELPSQTQRLVSRRLSELHRLSRKSSKSYRSADSPFFKPQSAREPYSGPPCGLARRQLSKEEKDGFAANPMTFIGRHFIHQPNGPEGVAYKVVGVSASEDGVLYQVIFIDRVDAAELNGKEMAAMVEESVILG